MILEKPRSIGFKSGEYGAQRKNLPPKTLYGARKDACVLCMEALSAKPYLFGIINLETTFLIKSSK